jgi:branched-chain amino acid transport system permease protein
MSGVLVLGYYAQGIVDSLLWGMVYALVAVGLALVWGVADIVNFAYGAYMVIAMVITIFAANSLSIEPLFLLPVNLVVLFMAGYLTYKVVISKVMNAPMLSQILVTFGLLLVLLYGTIAIVGPYTYTVEESFIQDTQQIAGLFVSIPLLVAAVVSTIFLIVGTFFLKYSKTGKAIRATAQDRQVARVIGIDPDRTFAVTWGLSTAAVGVSGTLLATFHPLEVHTTGISWTLLSFAAVALGGFGNIRAAAVGGLVIAFVEQFGVRLLNPSFNEIYVFIVFLLALLFREQLDNLISRTAEFIWDYRSMRADA